MPLRDYQKDAVRAYFAGIRDRNKVKVVELPTGTGKTWVGVAVAACLMEAGQTVLWVCKSRRLLRQAAGEFARYFPEYAGRVRWLDSKRCPGRLLRGGLVFTTLQSWHRRRHRLPDTISPAANPAVVWDEVHWAFHKSIGRSFREVYRRQVPILGLSATPMASNWAEVIYRKTPEDFFGTVLATPEFEHVETGVVWTPDVRRDEFTSDSLRVLAADGGRNALVVGKVVELLTTGRAKSILSSWPRLRTMFHDPRSPHRCDAVRVAGSPAGPPPAPGTGSAGDGPAVRRRVVPAPDRPAPRV
ncbi:Type III restriction enzyme, res subunit [Urbifossiella limnaea]|uniref:Type III restriction enzyme, res subunit n=2 Tax=Urbifossiella limnaea TaxID=2528023 RepID=A0A517XTY3_9BACT|nr:Type III restriction enzyme, res subunit [Urbifossiella limnaea]